MRTHPVFLSKFRIVLLLPWIGSYFYRLYCLDPDSPPKAFRKEGQSLQRTSLHF
ncbi:uncharacterized protein PHALS_05950 [Plasmopara halstedii]|uniref:Uncharacterized protein n=1 Tax=Plasmopara halstedii TaxID=4781 RepID=A0A0P1AB88_PLAHL|nr:uncharacterized protein PHALS_05950 [Plasmopara halstedii]CEG37902.1 hypothetical protein PHALS_05950 [Plasmopara halstedii]|eukprot:XP_024574271.1 hypothetical protein PHALS_05950 [Plasmopara halstedii]